MTHVFHDRLPGFSPDQILVDGCPECEERGRNIELALGHMDAPTFRRAWRRAANWLASSPPTGVRPQDISNAEAPLLKLMFAMQVRFEPHWPLGTLPLGTR